MDVYGTLAGGDRRSVGDVAPVVEAVLADDTLFAAVFEGMLLTDPLLRMRCADAAEKITRERPRLLAPYARRLLLEVAPCPQQEVRWHVALMLPRVRWSPADLRLAVRTLRSYLSDESRIVRANSLDGLTGLAENDPSLRDMVLDELEAAASSPSPAVRARARKLRRRLAR